MKNKFNYSLGIYLLFTSFIFAQTTTFGDNAGTQGAQSSFFGYESGTVNTASDNTFIGTFSGKSNTTGFKNVFVGTSSGKTNTTGQDNVFVGRSSGFSNQTGRRNVFLGRSTGYSNFSASNNVFIGYSTGLGNTVGTENTFVGTESGVKNRNGNWNVFLGSQAGRNSSTGSHNVFLGVQSGVSNTTGSNNVFVGRDAGFYHETGGLNTFLGNGSGKNTKTGSGNVYLGANAGLNNVSGRSNVFIGSHAGYNELGNNKLYIANTPTDTPLLYGDFSSKQIGINTKNIPTGISLAVNGNSTIEGTINALKGAFDSSSLGSNGWIPVSIGREYQTDRRTFEFVVDPTNTGSGYTAFAITDQSKNLRHDFVSNNKDTWIDLDDHKGTHFFKLNRSETEPGKFNTYIHMPTSDARMVIGQYGLYLQDKGYKLVVNNGGAFVNGDLIANGNVGIGTSTPDAKLAVNGDIHAQEVTVDLIGWPDYVFEDTYTLPSLSQVEKHIKEKGHLVNIPSAKEVEEQGIQLGEMNKKLLEKIEELTLYTIAQEKKLSKQSEEIQKLMRIKTQNNEFENRLAKLEALLLKK
ncbi:hypothetical protein [Aquimarina mytili]|uniref:TMF family protein n=1 Tax=Aquimarina mytili TaxID=874423 RepID=A0A937DD28_9FLAO|nr:hypothetical protein [Aquimarina mytili]MBL0685571.1 hypothetical protein [Aquimarina mytili]